MAQPPVSIEVAEATIAAIEEALRKGFTPPGIAPRRGRRGAIAEAANALGEAIPTIGNRLKGIERKYGLVPDWSLYEAPAETAKPRAETIADKVRERLRRSDCDMAELRSLTGLGEHGVRGLLDDLKADGFNIGQFGDRWSIAKAPPLPSNISQHSDDIPTLLSRPDNTFLVGVSGDQHLCSKYERLDVLNDLYDRFEKAGVQCVYNTGNWIDGEANFNRHDLHTHGMEMQCRYLAETFPRRNGLVTYAVTGDDHEGWYGQREGIDIGRFAENKFHDAGRSDWVHLGFMEAFVRLVNTNTGKSSILSVAHPGGGSSYAVSYSIQKIIEALDGGEKPAVGFYGHYHKLWAGNIRNVWCLQSGCTQDQTPWMRKKKIDAHVGGAIVEMEQDPDTGAIIGFLPNMKRYFNRGYYQNRWNQAGTVTLAERSP